MSNGRESPSTPSSAECRHDRAIRFLKDGRCPFPLLGVPAPGEVGVDYKATCRCGKRVAVTARGLLAHHKPARTVARSEVK